MERNEAENGKHYVSGVTISSRRINIPQGDVERYNVEEGEFLRTTVVKNPESDDPTRVVLGDIPVRGGNRLSVRKSLAEAHGLEGEYVDIEFSHTGVYVDDGE